MRDSQLVIPMKFANGTNGRIPRVRVRLLPIGLEGVVFFNEAKGRESPRIGGFGLNTVLTIRFMFALIYNKQKAIMMIKLIDWKINYYNGLFVF